MFLAQRHLFKDIFRNSRPVSLGRRVSLLHYLFCLTCGFTSVAFFFENSAQAQSATSQIQAIEFMVEAPWPSLEQKIQDTLQSKGTLKQDKVQQSLQVGEFLAQIPLFHFEMNGLQNSKVSMRKGQLQFQAQDLDFFIHIPEFQIDQEIVRDVQGAQVRVRVKANCGPISLKQKIEDIHAVYDFSLDRQSFQGGLTDFRIRLNSESFALAQISCQGPQGLDLVIQQKLTGLFSDSENISLQIKNYFSPFIQNTLKNQLALVTQGLSLPEKFLEQMGLKEAFIQMKDIHVLDKGVRSIFWLQISSELGEVLALENHLKSFSDQMSLRMSKKALLYLFRLKVKSSPNWIQETANQYDAFQRILNSRFLQFFLWPDLFNYSKKSTFELWHYKPEIHSIDWSEDFISTQLGLGGWLKSFRKGQKWDYVAYGSRADLSLQPQIKDGVLNLQIIHLNISPQFSFGSKYLSFFNANSWIASSLFKSLLQNYLQNKNWQIALPVFKINQNEILKIKNWSIDQEQVQFLF